MAAVLTKDIGLVSSGGVGSQTSEATAIGMFKALSSRMTSLAWDAYL